MKKIEKNYYVESLKLIDNVLKGVDKGDDIRIEEFTMWYYFLKFMGEHIYNDLMKKESFESFHISFKRTEIDMDLFKAPLHEITLTSVSSDDESSYKERKTYRRTIDVNENSKMQMLIWNFICISTVPKYIWKTVKNISDENKLEEHIGDIIEGEVRENFTDVDEMLSHIKGNLEKYYSLTIWHGDYLNETLSYITKFLQENHIHFIDELNGFWCFKDENDLIIFKEENENRRRIY